MRQRDTFGSHEMNTERLISVESAIVQPISPAGILWYALKVSPSKSGIDLWRVINLPCLDRQSMVSKYLNG
jgi:hypothetical protein